MSLQLLDPLNMILNLTDNLEWWQVLLIVADYSLKLAALGWVPHDRRPTSAMAWLLAIFLVPFFGLLLFFLMGSPYINRRRHRIQKEANKQIREIAAEEPDVPEGFHVCPEVDSLVKLNRELTSLPATEGKLHKLHDDYKQTVKEMAEVVDRAEDYVHCEIYIMAWDSTTDPLFLAFERAVQRGVKVRILYDHLGSHKYKGNRRLGKRLKKMGVEHHVMLPLKPWRWRFRRPDLRNHRKLLVVDGKRAFIGSQNLIEPEYQSRKNHRIGRRWHDIMAEVSGPVVTTINSVFAVDWYTESGERLGLIKPAHRKIEMAIEHEETGSDLMQVIPSGPGFTTEPNLRLFTSVCHHAKRRLILVSPYFIPDESLLEAVTTACYRGVEVELFVSEKSDQALVGHAQASYYNELLRAGVQMFLYPAPGVLHTKFVIADEEVALMGSSNMDPRSFSLNYEVTVMTAEGELMDALRNEAQKYKQVSHSLTREEWALRPWYKRYVDNVARLTSSLQ